MDYPFSVLTNKNVTGSDFETYFESNNNVQYYNNSTLKMTISGKDIYYPKNYNDVDYNYTILDQDVENEIFDYYYMDGLGVENYFVYINGNQYYYYMNNQKVSGVTFLGTDILLPNPFTGEPDDPSGDSKPDKGNSDNVKVEDSSSSYIWIIVLFIAIFIGLLIGVVILKNKQKEKIE